MTEAERADGTDPARGPLHQRALRRLHADLLVPASGSFMALDGLRAFAILGVLLFHCAVFSNYTSEALISSGLPVSPGQRISLNLWSGVDLFFVLSGFLIGRILLRDLSRHGRLFYASFFVRRGLRIFPAYYLVLTLSLVWIVPRAPALFSHLWNTSAELGHLAAEWRQTPLAQAPNGVALLREQWGSLNQQLLLDSAWTHYTYLNNYLIERDSPKLMSWAWSLCIEEHFYLVLPPLLWLSHRRRHPAWRRLGLAVGLLAPFGARLAAFMSDPAVPMADLYEKSQNRMDELFVGVVVAHLYVHHRVAFDRAVQRAGFWLPLAGASAIGAVWWFGSAERAGWFPVLAQFPLLAWGCACFVAGGIATRGRLTRFLSHRVWYPIARVSYGMYLVHPLVLFGLLATSFRPILAQEERAPLLGLLYVVTVALSWLVAAVLFVAIERPLLDLGGRLAKRLRG